MNKKINTFAIVLDTNSFGKANKYNFKQSRLTLCVSHLKEYSNIKIFMPSIVYYELKKHIRETVNKLRETINNSYLKQYIDLDNINAIIKRKTDELDIFIKNNNITIIDCNKYSDLSTINKWYFECKKPFSISKQKEFPDAMILSSTMNYFKKHSFDKVIMISEDNDIISGIKENTNFSTEKNIQNILNELLGFTDDECIKCMQYIDTNEILSKEESYSFYCYDSSDYYEINSINYKTNKIVMIDKNEDEMYYQLCVNCNISICGEFEIIDQNISFYDREDPECSVYWHRTGKRLDIDNIDVYISIFYDNKKNLTDYEVTKIEDISLNDYIEQLELQE